MQVKSSARPSEEVGEVSNAEQIAQALGGEKRTTNGWVARCPAHEDHHASLDIRDDDDGGLLWHCKAGCDQTSVLEALRGCGLLNGKERGDQLPRGPEQSWRIPTANGQRFFEHVRYVGKDGKKGYCWRPKLSDFGVRSSDLALYRADRIGDAQEIIVAEGESDCDAAVKLRLVAVGTVGGANVVPCDAALEVLRGRDVVMWQDADEPGEKHMREIAARLRKIGAKSIKIVRMPNCTNGEGAADFVEKGGTLEQFRGLPEVAGPPAPAPFFKLASSFPPGLPEPEELVKGIIPRASLGFIAGAPKAGRKTTFATSLLVSIAGGKPWLGFEAKQGRALLLAAEESEASTLRRIRAVLKGLVLHPDEEARILANIAIGCAPPWTLDGLDGQQAVIAAIEFYRPSVVILDPLTRITLADENDRTAVEPLLSFLKGLALKYETAIVLIHHSNKGAAGAPSPENMLRGSSALRGAHDFLCCSSPTENGGNKLYFELRYHESFTLDVVTKFSEALGTVEIEAEWAKPTPTKTEIVADLQCRVERILAGAPSGISRNGIVSALKLQFGKEPKATAIQDILEALASHGKAKSSDGHTIRANGAKYKTLIWSWKSENRQETFKYQEDRYETSIKY